MFNVFFRDDGQVADHISVVSLQVVQRVLKVCGYFLRSWSRHDGQETRQQCMILVLAREAEDYEGFTAQSKGRICCQRHKTRLPQKTVKQGPWSDAGTTGSCDPVQERGTITG